MGVWTVVGPDVQTKGMFYWFVVMKIASHNTFPLFIFKLFPTARHTGKVKTIFYVDYIDQNL